MSLEARGGVEPRACPPSSRRFGLEDRCRERGPTPHVWPGREAVAPLNSTLPCSHRSARMSHAPITWCPRKDLNLQPLVCRTSAPSIELLGRGWRSELDSNQPLGFFRPRANPPQLSDRKFLPQKIRVHPWLKWNSRQDSNPQLRRSKRRALPVELQEH